MLSFSKFWEIERFQKKKKKGDALIYRKGRRDTSSNQNCWIAFLDKVMEEHIWDQINNHLKEENVINNYL